MNDKKPIIGIVGRSGKDDGFKIVEVIENYRKAVIQSGGIPILILPPLLVDYIDHKPVEIAELTRQDKEIIDRQLELCDGVLIPGGTIRYQHDFYILAECLKRDIPVLGICLGMQIMAMLKDVNTLENVNNLQKIDSVVNHCDLSNRPVHEVSLKEDSFLAQSIGKKKFLVNSRHNYAISAPFLFNIVGFSEDGYIEAIERKDKRLAVGVQWHPEIMTTSNRSNEIIDLLIKKSKIYKEEKETVNNN